MNKIQIVKLFQTLETINPNPQTQLQFHSTFQLLIAVILSAQATDKSVNLATPALFQVAPDAFKMRELGENAIKIFIQKIGLYQNKAKHIFKTSQILCEKYNGNVPNNFEDLIQLPGVGRKTANVVLNVAFHQPTIAVDTHIFRLANRTGLAPGKNVVEVEKNLLKRIPSEFLHNAHHLLILHGRYICKARKPLCKTCPIAQYCDFFKNPRSSQNNFEK